MDPASSIIFDLEAHIREAKCLSETLSRLFNSLIDVDSETRAFLASELNQRLEHIQSEWHRWHAESKPPC
jgi:hypothetical protein